MTTSVGCMDNGFWYDDSSFTYIYYANVLIQILDKHFLALTISKQNRSFEVSDECFECLEKQVQGTVKH